MVHGHPVRGDHFQRIDNVLRLRVGRAVVDVARQFTDHHLHVGHRRSGSGTRLRVLAHTENLSPHSKFFLVNIFVFLWIGNNRRRRNKNGMGTEYGEWSLMVPCDDVSKTPTRSPLVNATNGPGSSTAGGNKPLRRASAPSEASIRETVLHMTFVAAFAATEPETEKAPCDVARAHRHRRGARPASHRAHVTLTEPCDRCAKAESVGIIPSAP